MKGMHISFDDVCACLWELIRQNFSSVFEQSFFRDLKEFHETTGAVFTLNCFNTCSALPDYEIGKLPDCFAGELSSCAGWLRFAFHAENDRANYGDGGPGRSLLGQVLGDCAEELERSYERFRSAVLKFAGTEKAVDRVTRLGFFAGTEENMKALRDCPLGILGLLTADDSRLSYDLTAQENEEVCRRGFLRDPSRSLVFVRTERRLERVSDIEKELEGLAARRQDGGILEIFTHESEYPAVRGFLKRCLEWAAEKGYTFCYIQDELK